MFACSEVREKCTVYGFLVGGFVRCWELGWVGLDSADPLGEYDLEGVVGIARPYHYLGNFIGSCGL